MMGLLIQEHPIQRVCAVLDVVRASYDYQPKGKDESALRAAIEKVAGEWPTYGYRRITAQLRREGWEANHKRVMRLMADMGLQQRRKRSQPATTDSRHGWGRYPNWVADLMATIPDEVWVADLTFVALRQEYVY